MTETKKYRNAPLVLTIFQVAHTDSGELTRGDEAGLKQELVRVLPLSGWEDSVHFDVSFGPEAPMSSRQTTTKVLRFSSRDKRTSATFTPTLTTIETTNYDTWEALRELSEVVFSARSKIVPVDGVERIGLRYIDELRIPDDPRPDWSKWVDPRLAPVELEEADGSLRVDQHQATIQYSTSSQGVQVVLRYGALYGPSSVGDIQLARPAVPPPGPYFLIDSDAAWSPVVGQDIPPLEVASVLEKADVLHGFVKKLFESSLTDRIRKDVLDA